MPVTRPRLPSAADLPEIEEEDDLLDSTLPVEMVSESRLTAEAEVSETLADIVVQSFEDARSRGPLDFQDGGEMGRRLPG